MHADIEEPSAERGVRPTRRVRATLGLFSVLAAASCAPEDRAFTVETSFTEAQRSTITRAGRAWDEMLVSSITFDGGDWRMVRGQPPPGYVAWTDAGARLVTIGGDVADSDLYRVVLHELGHSVGFFHHEAAGVMNPRANASAFTDADRAECASVHRCK